MSMSTRTMLLVECHTRLFRFFEEDKMSAGSASRDDFQLDEGYELLARQTLEQVLTQGESEDEKNLPSERVSVNVMPQWIASVLTNLKQKHHLSSVAVVQ